MQTSVSHHAAAASEAECRALATALQHFMPAESPHYYEYDRSDRM